MICGDEKMGSRGVALGMGQQQYIKNANGFMENLEISSMKKKQFSTYTSRKSNETIN
jgi:hypothetical protein